MNTYILFSNFEDLPKLILVPPDVDIKLLESIDNRIWDDDNGELDEVYVKVLALSAGEELLDMSEVNGRIINIGWCA